MRVLVVDGANVVGSRPDGWWRDRPGAARRLWEQLIAADVPTDELVLLLEGAARKGVAEGAHAHVRVAHAAGDGDNAIVDHVARLVEQGHEVAVVTADRELIRRVEAAGGGVHRPSWLLELL